MRPGPRRWAPFRTSTSVCPMAVSIAASLRAGSRLPQRHEREHAQGSDEQHCALNHPRRHEADGGALVLALHDREEGHRRADAGHAGAEVEKHPQRIWPSFPAVSTALGSVSTGAYRKEGGIPATNIARYSRPATNAVLRNGVTTMSSCEAAGRGRPSRRWLSSVAADRPDNHGGWSEVEHHLFWLIVPTITAPVSTNVINPASTAASSGSTEVSACPLTVLAKGRVSPGAGVFISNTQAPLAMPASLHTTKKPCSRCCRLPWFCCRDVADDVVVPERRSKALGRVVLRRDHVEVVEIVGNLALEL